MYLYEIIVWLQWWETNKHCSITVSGHILAINKCENIARERLNSVYSVHRMIEKAFVIPMEYAECTQNRNEIGSVLHIYLWFGLLNRWPKGAFLTFCGMKLFKCLAMLCTARTHTHICTHTQRSFAQINLHSHSCDIDFHFFEQMKPIRWIRLDRKKISTVAHKFCIEQRDPIKIASFIPLSTFNEYQVLPPPPLVDSNLIPNFQTFI